MARTISILLTLVIGISLVALVTVAAKSVEGTSFGYRLSSYFDLPETLLMVILIWLIARVLSAIFICYPNNINCTKE